MWRKIKGFAKKLTNFRRSENTPKVSDSTIENTSGDFRDDRAIKEIPNEIFLEILQHLNPNDLFKITTVSKKWLQLSEDSSIWNKFNQAFNNEEKNEMTDFAKMRYKLNISFQKRLATLNSGLTSSLDSFDFDQETVLRSTLPTQFDSQIPVEYIETSQIFKSNASPSSEIAKHFKNTLSKSKVNFKFWHGGTIYGKWKDSDNDHDQTPQNFLTYEQ